jgi:hypothetical protein
MRYCSSTFLIDLYAVEALGSLAQSTFNDTFDENIQGGQKSYNTPQTNNITCRLRGSNRVLNFGLFNSSASGNKGLVLYECCALLEIT